MILSGSAPADVAKSSHRPACFVPEAICAASSELPDARGQEGGPATPPLRLAGAGRTWDAGVRTYVRACVCARASVSEHEYVCPEGVVGGAGAGGRRKDA